MLQLDSLEKIPRDGRPLHLAIGMFDGMHRGHQAVIGAAIQGARVSDGRSAVLTFWPHPSRLFRPDNPTRMIALPEIKVRFLEMAGVQAVVQQRFDKIFAGMEAAAFPGYLKEVCPDLAAIYVGENFRFGKNRTGDIRMLVAKEPELGVQVVSAERIRFNGEPVSSTRIREALAAGRIEDANHMLGYSYFSLGRVVPGNHKGSEIGFPTLNLPWDPECRPAFGVYAVRVCGWDPDQPGACRVEPGSRQPGLAGVANYGMRPTVGDLTEPLLEVHLLEGPVPWKADARLKVQWLRFIRPEQKFEGFPQLQAQIARDVAVGREFFGG